MNAISTILVDVNPHSDEDEQHGPSAVVRARQLAIATGASVELLVCDYLGPFSGGLFLDNESLDESRDQYLKDLKDWLEQRAARLRQDGIETRSHVEWHSPRYESILARAGATGADIIVRAARRHSRVNRMFFAATDWELVRRSPQLLWLVKKSLDPLSRGLRVLVAVDPVHPEEKKQGLDRKLVTTAEYISKLFGGSLHIFHAYKTGAMVAPIAAASHHGAVPVMRMSSQIAGELEKQREHELRKLAGFAGVPDDNVHLVAGNAADALDEVVSAQDIDVVVAGAVSRGRLERLLIGSTAEAILDHVYCDVVVVKPDGFPESNQQS
jgi:universal stress protein E